MKIISTKNCSLYHKEHIVNTSLPNELNSQNKATTTAITIQKVIWKLAQNIDWSCFTCRWCRTMAEEVGSRRGRWRKWNRKLKHIDVDFLTYLALTWNPPEKEMVVVIGDGDGDGDGVITWCVDGNWERCIAWLVVYMFHLNYIVELRAVPGSELDKAII